MPLAGQPTQKQIAAAKPKLLKGSNKTPKTQFLFRLMPRDHGYMAIWITSKTGAVRSHVMNGCVKPEVAEALAKVLEQVLTIERQ